MTSQGLLLVFQLCHLYLYQGSLNAVNAQNEAEPEAPQELGAPAPVPEACSLDDPDCEACQ